MIKVRDEAFRYLFPFHGGTYEHVLVRYEGKDFHGRMIKYYEPISLPMYIEQLIGLANT